MCTRRKPVSNLIYIQDLKVGHVSNRTTPDVVRERVPKVAYRYYVHGLRSRNDVPTCFPIQSCFINHLGKICFFASVMYPRTTFFYIGLDDLYRNELVQSILDKL